MAKTSSNASKTQKPDKKAGKSKLKTMVNNTSSKQLSGSKNRHESKPQKSVSNRGKNQKEPNFFVRVFGSIRQKWKDFRAEQSKHFHPHKSFKRSYSEDYRRPFETPGLLHHAALTFQTLFKNWRTFLPFLALMVVLYVVAVGLLSEEVYEQAKTALDEGTTDFAGGSISNFAKAGILLISTVTTGGLDNGMDDTEFVFMIMLFLIMWLVVIFLLRHFMAGEKPKLRDGLYNALAPLFATLTVFIVIAIEMIPIMVVVIAYSAAILTDFLSTPFYALLFFIFSAIMVLLSVYLLCAAVVALVAVTSPGLYPGKALGAASDVISGRRIKLVIRIVYMLFVVVLIYVITMLPIILLDMWIKNSWDFVSGWPIVPLFLLIVTCFVFMFATTYIYIYYRWLIDYKEK